MLEIFKTNVTEENQAAIDAVLSSSSLVFRKEPIVESHCDAVDRGSRGRQVNIGDRSYTDIIFPRQAFDSGGKIG